MTATSHQIGAPAGDIHQARIRRQELPLGQAAGDCLFQFPSGYRCALEHQHEDDQHVAIRLDRETGGHVVCDVAPAGVRLADLREAVSYIADTVTEQGNAAAVGSVDASLVRPTSSVVVNRHDTVRVAVSFRSGGFVAAAALHELMTRTYRVADSVLDGAGSPHDSGVCTVYLRPHRFV